jgi:hypothetical protein
VDREQARRAVATAEWQQACGASADGRASFEARLRAIRTNQRRQVPKPRRPPAVARRAARWASLAPGWDNATLGALSDAELDAAVEAMVVALEGEGLTDASGNIRGVRRRTDGTVERF